jgi:hypothetical protein
MAHPEGGSIYDWAVIANLQPEPVSVVEVPVRIQVDWNRLTRLVR